MRQSPACTEMPAFVISDTAKEVCVDVSNLEYPSSSFIKTIVHLVLEYPDHRVVILKPNRQVCTTLERLGLLSHVVLKE